MLESTLSAYGLAIADIKQHISGGLAHNANQNATNGMALGAELLRELQSGSRALQEGGVVEAIAAAKVQDAAEREEHRKHTKQAWEVVEGILSANGLPAGDPQDAVNLNNLDDWLEFHAAEIA